MNRIEVVPHNPAWGEAFLLEQEAIRASLGPLVLHAHHIGSTAIPGIYAKPIVDILLEVASVDDLDRRSTEMQALGFEVMGECGIPGRRYFRKHGPSCARTHHVHAFQPDSPEIERHLAFRDYMIAHPQHAQLYSDLKRRLAEMYSEDREAYMDGKDPFIQEYEAKALAWRASQAAE